MPRKHPPLTEEEAARVRSLAPTHTVEEIAKALGRQRMTVLNFVRREGVVVRKANAPVPAAVATPAGVPSAPVSEAAAPPKKEGSPLRKSPIWKQLKNQFSPEELEYIQARHGELLQQFNEEVFATEETQIFLLLKYEVFMERNSAQQAQAIREMEAATRRKQELALQGPAGDPEAEKARKAEIREAETTFQDHRSVRGNAVAEYVKLQAQWAGLLQALKATREQRVTRIENSKDSFLSVIKRLQLEEERDREGRHMEAMRRVTEREKQRLAEVHSYGDGQLDQPVLSSDTVV